MSDQNLSRFELKRFLLVLTLKYFQENFVFEEL